MDLFNIKKEDLKKKIESEFPIAIWEITLTSGLYANLLIFDKSESESYNAIYYPKIGNIPSRIKGKYGFM